MAADVVDLDIVIPVYEEGRNILATLEALERHVKARHRVLLCYDHDGDDTLEAAASRPWRFPIVPVKNKGRGAHGAVVTGFAESTAPAVLVFPADDDYNAGRLDAMVAKLNEGNEIVCASRFIPGGSMVGCPWLKAVLVRTAAFTLHHFARIPTHDASNGFRLFSRRLLDLIPIQSSQGFTYSLELLVKAHRLGLPIAEVPVDWFQRKHGASRFAVSKWLPAYLVWYRYAFATTWLCRGPRSIVTRSPNER